mgnify:CR=1 FL=1
MTIRKSDDIANDDNINSRIKNTVKIEEILERYNVDKTDNILPGDEALGYLNQKVDECIDTINDNATAVSSSGTVEKAKALNTARNIGGVSFDGTGNIDLPGVNATGNQNTSGRAATATLAAEATALETARTIGGVSFDGTSNINLPGVNTAGNQDTTGNASTATRATTSDTLGTARTIGGVSFNGSANIVPTGHKGSIIAYNLTPTDFYPISSDYSDERAIILTPNSTGAQATANNAGTFVCNVTIPEGLGPTHVVVYGSDTSRNTVRVYKNKIANRTNAAVDGGRSFAVGTNTALSDWDDEDSSTYYLTITVTTDGADSIYGGTITMS